jgi:hypothetical protein
MPLNDIATEQTKVTAKTQAATNQLLDYLATHPDATIRYHASDMILHIHSDASYLPVSNARSRLGGLSFLGRVTLTEVGHIQPPTPLRTDNSTAFGILNETIKQKRSKAMDMRYRWLTDRVRQKTI